MVWGDVEIDWLKRTVREDDNVVEGSCYRKLVQSLGRQLWLPFFDSSRRVSLVVSLYRICSLILSCSVIRGLEEGWMNE